MKVAEYLNKVVNFGGEPMTIGAVIKWFEDAGYPPKCASLWLVGYFNTHRDER